MALLKKKYVVFVGATRKTIQEEVLQYITEKSKSWELMVLRGAVKNKADITIGEYDCFVDFDDETSIKEWVAKYQDQILCVTARSEKNITYFKKIIPHLPADIKVPTVDSLEKSTEKTKMRKAFKKYDPSLIPRFKVIKDINNINIEEITKSLEFPVIIKPSGLDSSLLIQSAHYPEELEEVFASIKKKIGKLYIDKSRKTTPEILVEEIIEGNVYSVDAYVDDSDNVYFTPSVKYYTNPQKGFDEFFLYERAFPKKMNPEKLARGQHVAHEGIRALGLKNTTTHIEMIYTGTEWKIIEIGPRIGGNRVKLYGQCFGINHAINDLLIHMGKKPVIKTKPIGYMSVLYFFSQKEGFITEVRGIKRLQKLGSFYDIDIKLKKGEKALHAKNGGSYVFSATLFNTDRALLLKDKRTLEKIVHIETKKQKQKQK